MNGRRIRESLRAGRRIYATATVGFGHLWPKLLHQAQVDFVFVDAEHTPFDRATLASLCRSYASVNLPTVVRIPNPDPYEATKVLDGGAMGFIAPYIETEEQVRSLTTAARYRPLKGERAARAVIDPASLEPTLHEYLSQRNADTLFIANIESVPAIENLDALLAVGSIDAILIGPHDLSCSLGIPEQYTDSRFDEAVRHIIRKARQHQVGAGIHFWTNIHQQIEWAQTAGANLIMHSSDAVLFGQNLSRDLAEIRAALGQPDDATAVSTPPVI